MPVTFTSAELKAKEAEMWEAWRAEQRKIYGLTRIAG